MDYHLRIILKYNVSEDVFNIKTNARERALPEIILNFLRIQMGKGIDGSKVNELDEYIIDIDLDLNGDIFKCNHNCGNLGLRDGILLKFLDDIEIEGEKIIDKKVKYEFISKDEFMTI